MWTASLKWTWCALKPWKWQRRSWRTWLKSRRSYGKVREPAAVTRSLPWHRRAVRALLRGPPRPPPPRLPPRSPRSSREVKTRHHSPAPEAATLPSTASWAASLTSRRIREDWARRTATVVRPLVPFRPWRRWPGVWAWTWCDSSPLRCTTHPL